MDFDFGLRVPYSGPKTEIDHLLRNLGFTPRIDMGYDKIDYELPGVGIVEVFVDKEKTSEFQKRVLRDQLSIRPAVLSYLNLLVEHTVSVKIHGVHKNVTLPSLPAFFIHRLVTARFGEYRRGSYYYSDTSLLIFLSHSDSFLAMRGISYQVALQVVAHDFRCALASQGFER